jgi:hypothetical protein
VRIATALAVLAASCTKAPAPVTPTPVTGDQVTGELVEASCLAPGSSAAVLAELQLDGAADPSLQRAIACLFDGGTVASCNVGCGSAAAQQRGR